MGRAVQVDFLVAGLRDSNGEPLALGKVFHYVAGTTTDKDVYTAYDKSATAAQPVVLDANGKALIYADGAYKFVIKDANDVTLYTHDNLFFEYDDGVATYGGTSSGAANTYAISPSPSVPAWVTGQLLTWLTHQANTSTTPTVSQNGLSAKTITNAAGAALFSGEIPSGEMVRGRYDGTNVRLYPPLPQWQTWVPTYSASGSLTWGAATTFARYWRFGKIVFCCVAASGTLGGSASTALQFTLPFTATSNSMAGGGYVADSGANKAAFLFLSSTTVAQVFKYDVANYATAGTGQMNVFLVYEAA